MTDGTSRQLSRLVIIATSRAFLHQRIESLKGVITLSLLAIIFLSARGSDVNEEPAGNLYSLGMDAFEHRKARNVCGANPVCIAAIDVRIADTASFARSFGCSP